MHRVLTIAEILRTIFSFLDKPSNARNARIRKDWSPVALDHVWAEAEPDIFRSLCPMDITESHPGGDSHTKILVSDESHPCHGSLCI